MLKHIAICGALAFATCFAFSPKEASAQEPCGALNFGYQYGVGLGSSYMGHTRLLAPHDRPPHFALYPPVYYSDVLVRRPYGISPFAAPPGIRPVELDLLAPPEPVTVENPYFEAEPQTAEQSNSETQTAGSSSKQQSNTTQFVNNPFYVDPSFVQR